METSLEVKVMRRKWIYFFRQLMVCSGVWTTYFMTGQFLGTPAVLVPQLRRESPNGLDDDMASWLYSVFGFAAVPWVFVLSFLSTRYGLRTPHIMSCIAIFVANAILFFSTSPLQILISEIVFGLGYANALAVGIVIISEYSSSEYRGLFLTFKAASLFWGFWSANAIGTFFHWKNITYLNFLCSVYTITFIFWPESPRWLASKRRFDDCREAYYWLQGCDEKSEKEVEEIIAYKNERNACTNDWNSISSAIRTVASREFYAPFLLVTLLVIQYHLAAKFICAMYVLEILKKMTGSESSAYVGMLVLDGITVASMYFGCFLAKVLNRRTLYLVSSVTAVAFLMLISLYLYLVKLTLVTESSVWSIAFFTCYSTAIGFGPMIMNMSIYAELIPLRFKTLMFFYAALLFYTSFTVLLKVTPYMFKGIGFHGTFLFYGTSAGICTALLYKFLPETKDRTLTEIEENFKTHAKLPVEMERLKSSV